MSERPIVETFSTEDPRSSEFAALHVRVRGTPDLEPPASGSLCLLARRGCEPAARCAILVADNLRGAPGASGLVGHYEAADAEAGAALLRHASAQLAARGVARVLGPLDGSTWSRYRLALPLGQRSAQSEPPPFLGEPTNPFDYPKHWGAAGFSTCARYESRIESALIVDEAAVTEGARRLAAGGIAVRPVDPSRFEEEVDALYEPSLAAFDDNLYYSPISAGEFRARYQRFRPFVVPELVLIATGPDRSVAGYLFGYPDASTAEDKAGDAGKPRGSAASRAIVKTVAVHPAHRGQGLGNHLLDAWRLNAMRLGFRSVIHALMLVSNVSMKMSARHKSEIFRRYALFQWLP